MANVVDSSPEAGYKNNPISSNHNDFQGQILFWKVHRSRDAYDVIKATDNSQSQQKWNYENNSSYAQIFSTWVLWEGLFEGNFSEIECGLDQQEDKVFRLRLWPKIKKKGGGIQDEEG